MREVDLRLKFYTVAGRIVQHLKSAPATSKGVILVDQISAVKINAYTGRHPRVMKIKGWLDSKPFTVQIEFKRRDVIVKVLDPKEAETRLESVFATIDNIVGSTYGQLDKPGPGVLALVILGLISKKLRGFERLWTATI